MNPNEQASGRASPCIISEDNTGEPQKAKIRYQASHLPGSKQKASGAGDARAQANGGLNSVVATPLGRLDKSQGRHVRNMANGVMEEDEEEIIDETIETDPDEE